MVKKVFRAVCGTMIYAIEPSDKELAYVHVFDSVQISQLSSKRASRVDNLGLSQESSKPAIRKVSNFEAERQGASGPLRRCFAIHRPSNLLPIILGPAQLPASAGALQRSPLPCGNDWGAHGRLRRSSVYRTTGSLPCDRSPIRRRIGPSDETYSRIFHWLLDRRSMVPSSSIFQSVRRCLAGALS